MQSVGRDAVLFVRPLVHLVDKQSGTRQRRGLGGFPSSSLRSEMQIGEPEEPMFRHKEVGITR